MSSGVRIGVWSIRVMMKPSRIPLLRNFPPFRPVTFTPCSNFRAFSSSALAGANSAPSAEVVGMLLRSATSVAPLLSAQGHVEDLLIALAQYGHGHLVAGAEFAHLFLELGHVVHCDVAPPS